MYAQTKILFIACSISLLISFKGFSTILVVTTITKSTGVFKKSEEEKKLEKNLLILFLATAVFKTFLEIDTAKRNLPVSFFKNLIKKKLPFTVLPRLKTLSMSFFNKRCLRAKANELDSKFQILDSSNLKNQKLAAKNQTLILRLPLLLRRAKTFRPFLDLERTLKPWVFFLFLFLGL